LSDGADVRGREQGRGRATLRIPHRCLVVLVGPSGSGKSTWAADHFRPEQVVSTDRLRALVGNGEHDQKAGKDAFAVLDLVLDRRLKRGLLTVVDSLGFDAAFRERLRTLARKHGTPTVAVVFDVPPDVCRKRNKQRAYAVPAPVINSQLTSWPDVRAAVEREPFDAVHAHDDDKDDDEGVVVVPSGWEHADTAAQRQQEDPMPLRFGLQLPRFDFDGGTPMMGTRLAEIAAAAEEHGFTSIWVMDHFLQIPQAGREWEDMLDSYTTLAYLAAHTMRATLGTMVTGVTYRNVAHLGKIVATLDVLSQGRAVCGIGAAWFQREHEVYGWPFPPPPERLDLLEDALQLLPLLWGPGSPPFHGKRVDVPETICYPRPLQEHVPILVGGGGEKRTLKLVAQYADACNVTGDAANVTHKLGVLHRHCADVGRDPATIEVTHLSSATTAATRAELDERLAAIRPANVSPEDFATRLNAGTVEDQVGRFRELAEAGVQHAIVNLPGLATADDLERLAPVIAAFN
jgi:F420-dependent oxidoreductase-like protein